VLGKIFGQCVEQSSVARRVRIADIHTGSWGVPPWIWTRDPKDSRQVTAL
jgi:hypothetical protein